MKGGRAIYITLEEGWCATLHQVTIDCNEGWFLDFTAHNNRLQWRGVWNFTLDSNRLQWRQRDWFLLCVLLWLVRRMYVVLFGCWVPGLQIAVEWLHECCPVVLPCASRDAGLRRDVAKRIVVAASKFLCIKAACVILLFFQLNMVNRIGMVHEWRLRWWFAR